MPLYPRVVALPTLSSAAVATRYLHPISPGTTANGQTGNGVLRLAPFWSPVPFTIDRLGGEIVTVGEAGSKLRCLIYLDNGFVYPGDLLLDAGQIAGDSGIVQDTPFTGPQVIPAGLTWWGGAIQAATTTQPFVRTTNALSPVVPLMAGTALPSANQAEHGYSQSSVTAAGPATFSTTVLTAASAPRLHCRVSAWG